MLRRCALALLLCWASAGAPARAAALPGVLADRLRADGSASSGQAPNNFLPEARPAPAQASGLDARLEANSWEQQGDNSTPGRRRLQSAAVAGAGLLAPPPPPPPPIDFSHLPNFEIGVAPPAKPTLEEWQAAVAARGGGTDAAPLELSSSSYVQPDHPGPGFLAMCLIARDAHADLLEWINHHIRLGSSKIYLWDHGSKPPMRDVITSYIASGLVEYHHFEAFEHPTGKPQLYAYDKCLEAARGRHDWLAFLDVDEFLVFKGPGGGLRSLPPLLLRYQEYSGLAVHWLIFGSSGHVERPAGGTLRSYVRRLPALHAQHQLVKSIVRVSCTSGAWGPHAFHHTCAKPVVRTDFSPINGPRDDRPVHEVLAVHHYATRSREEFKIKMARGSGMKRQRGWEYFDFVDSWSTEWDFDAYRIWDDNDLFQHYPAITKDDLSRYTSEAHEEHWLRGLPANGGAAAAGAGGAATGATAAARATAAQATIVAADAVAVQTGGMDGAQAAAQAAAAQAAAQQAAAAQTGAEQAAADVAAAAQGTVAQAAADQVAVQAAVAAQAAAVQASAGLAAAQVTAAQAAAVAAEAAAGAGTDVAHTDVGVTAEAVRTGTQQAAAAAAAGDVGSGGAAAAADAMAGTTTGGAADAAAARRR